ncbi:MAG: hypothetical protein O2948_12920 [Proteobacteria bacterium]|nr:hypothetical protein [Pseudomonadota bacterium]
MINRLILLFLLATPLANTANAQSAGDAEAQARTALDRFLVAFNSGDNDQVRDQVNFPAVTHGPNSITIATTPEEFNIPYAANRAQGWASSRWDSVITYFVSDEKVNFGVEFSRLNTAGEVYAEGFVFYVFTNQAGHWGMQYRAGDLASDRYDQTALETAKQEASMALQEFFEAFNAMDNAALRRLHHVPQALIAFENNQFLRAEELSAPLVNTNFARLQSDEDWLRSEYEDARILGASPTRVIFELTFQRVNTSGEVYMRIPALWVLARQDGRWGLQFRSLMTSTVD